MQETEDDDFEGESGDEPSGDDEQAAVGSSWDAAQLLEIVQRTVQTELEHGFRERYDGRLSDAARLQLASRCIGAIQRSRSHSAEDASKALLALLKAFYPQDFKSPRDV